METYAFANQKGGVGKTTVTLGLAAALARQGVSVLLIDLDPQASATKVLGVEVEERSTVADVLLEPDRFSLRDVVVRTDWGFDLAPAETALASRESRRVTADEFIFWRKLAAVVGFDVALVDCPPSLGLLTLNALTCRLAAGRRDGGELPGAAGDRRVARDARARARALQRGAGAGGCDRQPGRAHSRASRERRRDRALLRRRPSGSRCCRSGPPFRTRRAGACPSVSLPGDRPASSPVRLGRWRGVWRCRVSPSERRPALGARKQRRPHPAAPAESTARSASRVPTGPDGLGTPKLGDEYVMLCVRVAPSLRRRVKLAAVQCGQPVQQLAAEALEAQCQRYGV